MKTTIFIALSLILAPVPVAAAPASGSALVDRLLSDFAAERLQSIESYVADDAVMVTQLPMATPMRLVGKPQIAAYFTQIFDRYDAITLADIVKTRSSDGRSIVVEATGTYRTPAGESHSVAYVWIVTTRGGKLVSSRNYTIPLPQVTP
jgi:ketosteroid isomerase-like protein